MKHTTHILRLGSLSVLALALLHGSTQAQFGNPYQFQVQNQVAQQNLYMRQLMNQQAGQVFGTNYGIPTYASAVNNYYGMGFNPMAYQAAAFANPGFGVNPGAAMANPYSPVGAGFGINNPYSPVGVGGVGGVGGDMMNPFNPFNPFRTFGPGFGEGQYLQGSADVMRAYGTVINAQESARLMREQALQAKLDTKKKAFDLELYIKANTPTYTQDQERIARSTLRRIQGHSLPGEMANGKSLNYLLDDLRKFPKDKGKLFEPISLSEGVLTHLNVSKSAYGLGVLRDADTSRVVWPSALQIPPGEQKELDAELKELVKGAYKGQFDANVLNKVRNTLSKHGDNLVKRVNDTPTVQYMDAKRFVQEFNEACTAIEKGEAPVQGKFQRFIEGGKSVQDVVDFMAANGLRFGPATANDEAAYRAVHSALASFDIAMNSSFGVAENKDQ